MELDGKTPLAISLDRAGMSANKLASAIGTSRQNVSRWVKGDVPLPIEWAKKIAPVLNAGISWLVLGDQDAVSDQADTPAVAIVDDLRMRTWAASKNSIPEIDAFLGAGGGGYPASVDANFGNGSYSADAVRAEWNFPESFVNDELHARFGDIEIVGIRGDSMLDHNGRGFRDGDRVMVHRRDKMIRQGGIFAIRDDGEIIIKQVEPIRGSDPPRIRCTSLNQAYQPFELVLDGSAALIGRVILHIARV